MGQHVVVLRLIVEYNGEDRHFNADDVRYLAAEGVESHYGVISSAVVEAPGEVEGSE